MKPWCLVLSYIPKQVIKQVVLPGNKLEDSNINFIPECKLLNRSRTSEEHVNILHSNQKLYRGLKLPNSNIDEEENKWTKNNIKNKFLIFNLILLRY